MSNKTPKKSSGNKAALGAAAIGSAAVAAALLYAGKRFLKKSEDTKTPPTIPSGEPPETD
ncbi:isopropylmalate isomerase [Erythrobacter sp. T5W1-R]|uniref:isopropylmalate isomerase n=1 Tax=Erythrobacter sp. T5W1-R TaxID=3101752 RepID=UPI002B001D9C|nr:isopropylmalate isomerase [Erythrobacter sp. T5W1-R]MEA1619884.1 isopropylmalate isomerase [Erythrobacter sp. T5W1-R]